MMSFPVWLTGPMLLWGVSVSGPMFLPWGVCLVQCSFQEGIPLTWTSLDRHFSTPLYGKERVVRMLPGLFQTFFYFFKILDLLTSQLRWSVLSLSTCSVSLSSKHSEFLVAPPSHSNTITEIQAFISKAWYSYSKSTVLFQKKDTFEDNYTKVSVILVPWQLTFLDT